MLKIIVIIFLVLLFILPLVLEYIDFKSKDNTKDDTKYSHVIVNEYLQNEIIEELNDWTKKHVKVIFLEDISKILENNIIANFSRNGYYLDSYDTIDNHYCLLFINPNLEESSNNKFSYLYLPRDITSDCLKIFLNQIICRSGEKIQIFFEKDTAPCIINSVISEFSKLHYYTIPNILTEKDKISILLTNFEKQNISNTKNSVN